MQVMAAGETPSLRDLSFSRYGLFSVGSTSHPNWTLGKQKLKNLDGYEPAKDVLEWLEHGIAIKKIHDEIHLWC